MKLQDIKISAFADEISDNFIEQLEGLNANNVKYMEIRGVNGKNISALSHDEMVEAKKLLDKYGIKVSSIGSPIGKVDVDSDFDAHLKVFENILDAAKILDAKYIRIFSFFLPKEDRKGDGYKKHRDKVIARLEKFVELADKAQVILCHENESDIYGQSPEACLDLMKHFDGRIKCVFDHANFIVGGFTPYPDAFNMLSEYIEYLHIKDASSEGIMPAGLGDGRIKETLADLYAKGFDNFLTVEPHLSVFKGLEELGGSDKVKNKFKTKEEAFKVAVDSLRAILPVAE